MFISGKCYSHSGLADIVIHCYLTKALKSLEVIVMTVILVSDSRQGVFMWYCMTNQSFLKQNSANMWLFRAGH